MKVDRNDLLKTKRCCCLQKILQTGSGALKCVKSNVLALDFKWGRLTYTSLTCTAMLKLHLLQICCGLVDNTLATNPHQIALMPWFHVQFLEAKCCSHEYFPPRWKACNYCTKNCTRNHGINKNLKISLCHTEHMAPKKSLIDYFFALGRK